MPLRSPSFDLREFSESVADLGVLEIRDAILREMHTIKTQPRGVGRARSTAQNSKARQYLEDLQVLVPLFTGAPPVFRDGYVLEAWPMLRKLSETIPTLSSLRGAAPTHVGVVSLESLASKAGSHWSKWLPRRTARLKGEGTFVEATYGAALSAQREIEDLMRQGFRVHEAEEVALKQYILLDPEPDAELEDWERAELAEKEAAYRKAPPS